jgi:hypothetical protein
MAQAQAQMEAYQTQLIDLRQQLSTAAATDGGREGFHEPRGTMGSSRCECGAAAKLASETPATLDEIRERQVLRNRRLRRTM